MLGVPIALLCLVETLAFASPRVAVFPLTGESVSIADLPTVDAIDSEIRAAVKTRIGPSLQSKEETLTQVQVLKDVGLVCASDDIACQTRIAIMADVDEAITGVVSLRPGAYALSLTIIDRATTRVVASVKGPIAERLPDRARDIDALVERLLIERPPPTVVEALPLATTDKIVDGAPDEAISVSARSPPPTEADTHVTVAAADASSLATWLLVGGGLVAAAAGVATVGAIGAVIGLELALSSPLPWSTRLPLTYAGQGLIVVAALSAVALAAGAATATASFLVE